MKIGWVLSMFLGVTACGVQKPPANTRYDFGNIRWASEAKVDLKAHSSVPAEYVADIRDTFEMWNGELEKPLLYPRANQMMERTTKSFSNHDGTNGIYFICDKWTYGREGHEHETQAITQINLEDGQIREADMLINCQDFKFSRQVESDKVHLKSLVLHETGHVLGLPHETKNSQSIMYIRLPLGVERIKFTKSEIMSLKQATYPLAANVLADGLALIFQPEQEIHDSTRMQIQFSSEISGCGGSIFHDHE